MRYAVRHRTTFKYEQLVSVSHHVLHLTPRDFARQQCLSSAIDIEPTPTLVSEGVDYFGNNVQYLTVNEPHKRLLVEASSLVDVAASAPLDLTASPAWDELGQSLQTASTLEAYEFGFDSPCAQMTVLLLLPVCADHSKRFWFSPGAVLNQSAAFSVK